MQHDDEPWITPAEAAKKVGRNRSTISRQIRKGAIRNFHGKVKLSEVIADRDNNIRQERSGRRDGKSDFSEPMQQTSAVQQLPEPAHALAQLLVRSRPVIARMAVEAGCDMQTAYALAAMIKLDLHSVAGEILEEMGIYGPDDEGLDLRGIATAEPNWKALADKAGERADRAAWEKFLGALPWWNA